MIYVDALVDYHEAAIIESARRYGSLWCHMWSDSEDPEELQQFAESIGLRRGYLQDTPGFPHYDLVPAKRTLAVSKGAVETTLRDWIRKRKGLA
jgi:hypothetical protein